MVALCKIQIEFILKIPLNQKLLHSVHQNMVNHYLFELICINILHNYFQVTL